MEKGEPEQQDKRNVKTETDVKSTNSPMRRFGDQQPSTSQEQEITPPSASSSRCSRTQLESEEGETRGEDLEEPKPEKKEGILYSTKCTQANLSEEEHAQGNGFSTDTPLIKRRRTSYSLPSDEHTSTSSESIASSPSYFDEGMGGFTDEFEESSDVDLNNSTEQQQQQLEQLTMRPTLSTEEDSQASSAYGSGGASRSNVASADIEEIEEIEKR